MSLSMIFFFCFSYWNERISNMNHQMNWSIIWSRLDHYLDSHNHHHFLNHHHYHHHHYPFFMTLKAFLINISSLIMIAKRIELQQHQQKMEHNKHILWKKENLLLFFLFFNILHQIETTNKEDTHACVLFIVLIQNLFIYL